MSIVSGSGGRGSSVSERRGSMSDQPLLCKPALEREVTESLKIENPDFAPHLPCSTLNSLPSKSGRRVIKSSGRNYGSFTNTACTDSFFQHQVQPGETLQAISLKYNISIEQLKRINRLYSNEAFFLKELILIPCPEIIPIDMPLVSQDGATSLLDEIQIIEKNSKQSPSKVSQRYKSSSPKSISVSSQHRGSSRSLGITGNKQNGAYDDDACARNGYSNPSSGNEFDSNGTSNTTNGLSSSPNISDIFSRFDSALAATKSNVEKLTQNSCITPYLAAQNGFSCSDDTFGGSYRSSSPNPTTKGSGHMHSNVTASGGSSKSQSKKSSRVTDECSTAESVSLFPESKRHDELYKL